MPNVQLVRIWIALSFIQGEMEEHKHNIAVEGKVRETENRLKRCAEKNEIKHHHRYFEEVSMTLTMKRSN